MRKFEFLKGDQPFVMSVPHVGEHIPDHIFSRLSEVGRQRVDTDWYLDRLYRFVEDMGVSTLCATHSRYVIDLNRAPDDSPLYAGMNHTALVPVTCIDGNPLYAKGTEPTREEIKSRLAKYWQPYHDKLTATIKKMMAKHGIVILFDCHSIRSRVPRYGNALIDDFNVGTAGGTCCSLDLRDRLGAALSVNGAFTVAVDGLFKGGYIPRNYGRPAADIHAFQLELAMRTYMQESPPYRFERKRAERVRPHLRRMIECAITWATKSKLAIAESPG